MDLTHLKYVVALAETANFSRAAELLYIAQPTLSQQIGSLEEELGVKLFERTTRQVSLTAVGEEFVKRAKVILGQVDELARYMEIQRREEGSTLSVGLLSTLSHLNIPQYLNRFHTTYPDVHIELQVGWSSQLIHKVLSGELDAAITNIFLARDIEPDPRLDIQTVLEDYIVVLVSNECPLSRQKSVMLEELSHYPVIGLDKKTSIRMQMDQIFAEFSVPHKLVCTCQDMDSLVGMVCGNLGVTFLSYGVAQQYLTFPLSAVPLHPVYHTRTAMISRKERHNTPALRLFKDYFHGIIR